MFEIGKARIVQKGERVAIMALGTIIENALEASKIIKEKYNFEITIIDARFAKPFDENLVIETVKNHQIFITIEEGAIGGFGSLVGNFLHNKSLLDDGKCKFRSMFMADKFIEQNNIKTMRSLSGIGVDDILGLINKLL